MRYQLMQLGSGNDRTHFPRGEMRHPLALKPELQAKLNLAES